MKKFEFLPHTADLRIKAYGRNEKEVLLNSLLAINSFLDPKLTKESVSIEIGVSGKKPYLWIDFLEEVLSQIYIEKAIFKEIEFLEFGDEKIKARLSGFKFKGLKKDIKAITYHQAEIKEEKGLLTFTFVCDI
jgi:SHS2 domain-containing protein